MRVSLSGLLLSHPPADSAASLTICGALLQLFLPRGAQGSVRMGVGEDRLGVKEGEKGRRK